MGWHFVAKGMAVLVVGHAVAWRWQQTSIFWARQVSVLFEQSGRIWENHAGSRPLQSFFLSLVDFTSPGCSVATFLPLFGLADF